MIKLGDKVTDPMTGFTGIVVCRSEWLWGCVRIAVQSQEPKDGKPIEEVWFDEPRLEGTTLVPVRNPNPIVKNPLPTGGPSREGKQRREG